MSDADLIERLVSDVMERHCTPEIVSAAEGGWSADLWKALDAAGLTRVGVSEERGGPGGGWPEAAAVLRMAGRWAAPVPLAETSVLAGWLLDDAGLELPDGPLTIAGAGADQLEITTGRTARLRGRVTRVPWAREAASIVVVAKRGDRSVVAVVPPSLCRIERGLNVAREPRDTVIFEDVDLGRLTSKELADDDGIEMRGALARCIQMSGALDRVLELTADYAKVRQQFGRAIVQFQAVQHELALLAGEAEAASAAVRAAVRAVSGDGARSLSDANLMEVAAAKVRVGMAASEGARIAHQIHGAIGITYEHQLHHFTSRLWSWRDEFGSERRWATRLGRALAGSGTAYWERLTQPGTEVAA